nr:toll/interleukin-1 receptor domain-containing protein [Streptomyces sp. NBC_00899]
MPEAPFFFTSYAVRRADSELVRDFHKRPEDELQIKRGRTPAPAGFLDRESLHLGGLWAPELRDALRTTRFLVALLSDDYLGSRWCGREWAVMSERLAAVQEATGRQPVAIIPLFWVHPRRPLPAAVESLMYHTEQLGDDYPVTCVADISRGSERSYTGFIIRLTDYLLRIADEPLPELDAARAESVTPAFASDAAPKAGTAEDTQAEAGPESEGAPPPLQASGQLTATADPGGQPYRFDRLEFLGALRRLPVFGTRDAYDVWIEAIRERLRPAALWLGTDGGSVAVRSSALLTAALTRPTPDLLLTLVECAEEATEAGDPHLAKVRRMADEAARNWEVA